MGKRPKNAKPTGTDDAAEKRPRWTPEYIERLLRPRGLVWEDYHFFKRVFVGHDFDYIVAPVTDRREFTAVLAGLTPNERHDCISRLFDSISSGRMKPKGPVKPGRETVTGGLLRALAAAAQRTSWQLHRKTVLTDAELIRHLTGKSVVGTGCRWDKEKRRFRLSYFLIDFDWRGEPEEQRQRYHAACKALGRPTLLFQSSASQGLHAYWFLDREVDLFAIRDPYGNGAVMRLIAAYGLQEQNGQLEVYPRGHYPKLGVQNRNRLPFGSESELLDVYTLEPITYRGPAADLPYVRRLFERGEARLVDTAKLIEDAEGLSDAVELRVRDGSPTPSGAADWKEYLSAERLWQTGLTGPEQFNAAIFMLACDLRRRGTPQDRAVDQLCDWVDSYHNGWSTTYNRSELAAYSEIEAVADRAYKTHSGKWRTGEYEWGRNVPSLSEWEFDQLVEMTESDYVLALPDDEGERQDRWWVQYYGFFLLRRAKEWVVKQVTDALSELRRGHVDFDIHNPDSHVIFQEAVRAFWPDIREPVFHVAIPDKLRATAIGLPKDTRYGLWSALKRAGLFTQVRGYSKSAKLAAVYRVMLDFHAYSVERTYGLMDFATTVRALVPKRLVDEWYEPDHVVSLRLATGIFPLRPTRDEVQSLIRALLSKQREEVNRAA